jgi:hypothetical protein
LLFFGVFQSQRNGYARQRQFVLGDRVLGGPRKVASGMKSLDMGEVVAPPLCK